MEEDQKSLELDFKKLSGIQFDPDDLRITSKVIDEIDYLRGLINHLWDHSGDDKSQGDFGTCLVFGWVDSRLIALRTHIDNVLKGENHGRVEQ